MQDWRDYVIPIMIGVLLVTSGLAWLVLTIRLEWGRFAHRVSTFFAAVMSRRSEAPEKIVPVVLRTDEPKAPDGPPRLAYSQEVLLDTYRWLRSMGAKREDARTHLKALGIPLSNDLWAKAEPPEPVAITPLAQRPTLATFRETDPELEYQKPPT